MDETDEIFRLNEEVTSLYQRIGDLEIRNAKMAKHRTPEGIEKIANTLSLLIEDEYVKHHETRQKRIGACQNLIAQTIREVLTGEQSWEKKKVNL